MPAQATRDGAPPEPDSHQLYAGVIAQLTGARVPFMVGGAYALRRYTGIERETKDLDIFIRREDCPRVMELLRGAGWRTELTHPHWLAKAARGDIYVDVIFSSGNGVSEVDQEWFDHAAAGTVLDFAVLLCPAEEMLWSKAFIMERERFDGADVQHLLRAQGPALDWPRLMRRFGKHWRILLVHLVIFGFTYPSDQQQIPAWVMSDLLGRLRREMREERPGERICNGTLVSRAQFLVDIERWGYKDGRLVEPAVMTREDVAHWTRSIEGGDSRG